MTSEYKDIRDMVFTLCEQSALDVSRLYDNAIMDIANLMRGVEITENMPFNFEDYGLQDKVDEIMDGLEASITHRVEGSVIAAYGMSYKNCEKLIKRAVGEQVSAKVQKAFAPKLRSKAAAQAFMRNVPGVNGKLWNGETLALMTSAVEDSIRQGMSASKMATKIKQYLNDPDDWHRRFRYKAGVDKEGNPIYRRKWKKREWDEETGKYKWVDHKPGEPHPGHVGGPGAYRSSYKNALRYARTTTNMAYRTADYDLYQDLPFVIGIEIRLSNNHPIPDICDTLAGRYPKEFKWTGWHPNCRCYQIPILAKSSETEKMVDAILDDKDPSTVHCDGVIDDLPDNFKGWLTNNQERLNTAVSMGRLPYFLKDNGTIDAGVYTLNDFTAKMRPLTPMEIAQQRHAARTDEQVAQIQARADERSKRLKDYALTTKRADNIMGMQGEWHEVDFSTLSTLLTSVHGKPYYKAGEMADLKNALQGIKTQIMAQKAAETALSDVIPDVHKWHKQFTISELQGVKDAVTKKIADYERRSKDLSTLKDNMEFEAQWVRDHKKYATWEVAEKAYLKKGGEYAERLAWKDIDSLIATAKTYGHISSSYDTLLQKAIALRGAKGDVKSVEKYLLDAELERKKWEDLDKRLAVIKGFKSKSSAYNDLVAEAERLRKAEAPVSDVEKAIKDAEDKKAKLWKKYGKKPLSSGEFELKTLDELKQEMGADLPKTLENLDKAIARYGNTNADFEKVRDEIEKELFKLFKENDLGMDISGKLLESVYNNGFYNIFQAGTGDGYVGNPGTSGLIPANHSRLKCAHELFGLGKNLTKDQLARREYEKYGHLLDHNKLDAFENNRTWYGTGKAGSDNQVQVRFKKDKVVCTWTFDDSLSCRYQPSLVTDPKIESLDNISTSRKPVSTDPTKLYEWQKKKWTSYVELQYHGELTIDDVEDIVFAKNPELVITKDLIGKLQAKGIKLYYYDGSAIVEY